MTSREFALEVLANLVAYLIILLAIVVIMGKFPRLT